MKTLGSLKNRRLANTIRNHAVPNSFVVQINVMLQQCFHAGKLLVPAFDEKPVLRMETHL